MRRISNARRITITATADLKLAYEIVPRNSTQSVLKARLRWHTLKLKSRWLHRTELTTQGESSIKRLKIRRRVPLSTTSAPHYLLFIWIPTSTSLRNVWGGPETRADYMKYETSHFLWRHGAISSGWGHSTKVASSYKHLGTALKNGVECWEVQHFEKRELQSSMPR